MTPDGGYWEATYQEARPYRLVGRLKNNRLWSAIMDTFPAVKTQTDAAKSLGTRGSILGALLNGKVFPYRGGKRGRAAGWWPLALKIERALGRSAEYLFDRDLYGVPLPQVSVELVFDPKALSAAYQILSLPPHQEDGICSEEQRAAIVEALATLAPREANVLKMRFGLSGHSEHTLDEVGRFYGVTRTRVRQIECRALHKLRHPCRSAKLRPTFVVLRSDPDKEARQAEADRIEAERRGIAERTLEV